MKAITFYYENTESKRNLPEQFSCYVSEELFNTLQKHDEEQGCLIELENGSQIYLGSEADKAEPKNNSDFSFIKDEDTLLRIVSYGLALKDYLFANQLDSNVSLHNYHYPVISLHNYHYPVEAFPETQTVYFSYPVGNGLFFNNCIAEVFEAKHLPEMTNSCYKHVEHEHMQSVFNDGKKPEEISQKDIFADYMENIRFFTEYRQKFLNENVQDIFNKQDISPFFSKIEVPNSVSEETLNQVYFCLKDDYKKLIEGPLNLEQFNLVLQEDCTINLIREDLEPLNLLPNQVVEADLYLTHINYHYNDLSAEITRKIADSSLGEQFMKNLNLAYEDMYDLGDFEAHIINNELTGELSYSLAGNDLRSHFLEMCKDEGLDITLFEQQSVSMKR